MHGTEPRLSGDNIATIVLMICLTIIICFGLWVTTR